MNVYYVKHSELGKDALVHAPSTEKARTAFLDYLERNGMVSRKDRQSWRKGLITDRVEEGETSAEVELWYGYTPSSVRVEYPSTPAEPAIEPMSFEDEQEVSVSSPPTAPVEAPPSPPSAPTRRMSPIAAAAMRGFVR